MLQPGLKSRATLHQSTAVKQKSLLLAKAMTHQHQVIAALVSQQPQLPAPFKARPVQLLITLLITQLLKIVGPHLHQHCRLLTNQHQITTSQQEMLKHLRRVYTCKTRLSKAYQWTVADHSLPVLNQRRLIPSHVLPIPSQRLSVPSQRLLTL